MTIYVRGADVCIALTATIHEGSRHKNALKSVDCPRRERGPKRVNTEGRKRQSKNSLNVPQQGQ
jgi:hypothetical protein